MTDAYEAAPPPRSAPEVKAMLEGTEKGGVRNSIQNCLTVFQHDPVLSGAVAKNLLTERIDLLKPIGRKHRTGGRAMTDTDMKYIRLYLENTYGLTSEKKIADAAALAADANSYHPIQDYLNGLVWDGKERIRFCLRHFLGADTDGYTYEALRLFLLGAIHRAFCPGCKFEVMLCLVGGQGVVHLYMHNIAFKKWESIWDLSNSPFTFQYFQLPFVVFNILQYPSVLVCKIKFDG